MSDQFAVPLRVQEEPQEKLKWSEARWDKREWHTRMADGEHWQARTQYGRQVRKKPWEEVTQDETRENSKRRWWVEKMHRWELRAATQSGKNSRQQSRPVENMGGWVPTLTSMPPLLSLPSFSPSVPPSPLCIFIFII
jgi:hypothetical protein